MYGLIGGATAIALSVIYFFVWLGVVTAWTRSVAKEFPHNLIFVSTRTRQLVRALEENAQFFTFDETSVSVPAMFSVVADGDGLSIWGRADAKIGRIFWSSITGIRSANVRDGYGIRGFRGIELDLAGAGIACTIGLPVVGNGLRGVLPRSAGEISSLIEQLNALRQPTR
jgi:hypothetical protein